MGTPAMMIAVAAAALIIGPVKAETALHPEPRWTSPFQAGQPSLARGQWRPISASRCDRSDPLAKCTFTARIDYNGDGRLDVARMVEGAGISAILVDMAGAKSKSVLAATFEGQWNGGCYIAADAEARNAIAFTCPEASAALFKLRRGKPAALWLAD